MRRGGHLWQRGGCRAPFLQGPRLGPRCSLSGEARQIRSPSLRCLSDSTYYGKVELVPRLCQRDRGGDLNHQDSSGGDSIAGRDVSHCSMRSNWGSDGDFYLRAKKKRLRLTLSLVFCGRFLLHGNAHQVPWLYPHQDTAGPLQAIQTKQGPRTSRAGEIRQDVGDLC